MSYSEQQFDMAIGKLDRSLSELLTLAEAWDGDPVDAQTLKHHADDLLGVGYKVKELLERQRVTL